jgi:hypothetical protein
MPAEIKIQCECGHTKLISKSNISAHKKSKTHIKNMAELGQGTNDVQEFENTIICHEVKATEPKVKKTVVKKTSGKVKVSKKFLTAITKVINIKIAHTSACIPVEIAKPVINSDKLKELQSVIDNGLNIIKELEEEIRELKQEAETKELAENYFDNPEIDPVYRYTVWMLKQYFTNRVIEEIKKMRHPIFKGIDEEEVIKTIEEPQKVEEVIKTIEEVQKVEEVIKTIEEVQKVEEVIKTIEEVQEVEEVIKTIEEPQKVEEVIKTIEEPQKVEEVIKTIEEPQKVEEVIKTIEEDKKRKDTYTKTKQRNKELKTQHAIAVLFDEEFDETKPYLCDIDHADFKELKNYKTRISNALKWIDESLVDCFHLDYTHSIIYNIKKKEVYLHLTDNETGKLFVRLCEKKIYYDTVSLYNKPNPKNANFTMKKFDKKPLSVMFEKIKKEIINIFPT